MSNVEVPKFTPGPNRKIKFNGGQSFEYEIFSVLDEYNNPLLKKECFDWDFNNPPGDLRHITISLLQTMAKNGGVGLAANQVGLPYKVFVMGAGESAFGIINPKILNSDGVDVAKEGCLSFPGLFLKVKRATSIEVNYFDMYGKEYTRKFEGLTARIFLHEYDHLMGIRFIDVVSKIEYQRGKDKCKSMIKKMKKMKEQMERQEKLQNMLSQFQQKKNQQTVQSPVILPPIPVPQVPKQEPILVIGDIPEKTPTLVIETPNPVISVEK